MAIGLNRAVFSTYLIYWLQSAEWLVDGKQRTGKDAKISGRGPSIRYSVGICGEIHENTVRIVAVEPDLSRIQVNATGAGLGRGGGGGWYPARGHMDKCSYFREWRDNAAAHDQDAPCGTPAMEQVNWSDLPCIIFYTTSVDINFYFDQGRRIQGQIWFRTAYSLPEK
jgi:hypothetical protein